MDKPDPMHTNNAASARPGPVDGLLATERIAREDLAEVAAIRSGVSADRKVVFVSGNFNVLHPGHLRLLNFAAECGDYLVVGLHPDGSENVRVRETLRLEGVRSISVVDHAFVLRSSQSAFLSRLRPDIVVKGKEHELGYNAELEVLMAYGGRLIFSSGEARFSSLDLLKRELNDSHPDAIIKPQGYPQRHGFTMADLSDIVGRMHGLRVLVVGDLIVDEYINCEPLGMSREDPTIVVSPLGFDRFVGGAGIVAAHACGLGGSVRYVGVCGKDDTARFASEQLSRLGVRVDLLVDDTRPTTLKQRYRADGKTLLRVSHMRQHEISEPLRDQMRARVLPSLDDTDLVVFSDFNYGCLPQSIVDEIIGECRRRELKMVADSQASSQVSDIARFSDMELITPTEYEARLSTHDRNSGLTILAEALQRQTRARNLIITLGAEGLLVHAPQHTGRGVFTDRLPAFNSSPRDVSGAGDSLFICASMAILSGADVWQAAYLGSIAAACQVGRVGNLPVTSAELIQILQA
jgi:rfaE bifunctional protein kinase chain/domain